MTDDGERAGPDPREVEPAEHARRALHAYRERRRRRRDDDTWFGSEDVLLAQVEEGLDAAGLRNRHEEILDEAREAGMPAALADLTYDVARQEGIDPALALQLVLTGLGVAPPEGGVDNAPSQPASDKYRPEWLRPPDPPDRVLRERMLRLSFRRLRALLERHREVEDALLAFAAEPDVGRYGY